MSVNESFYDKKVGATKTEPDLALRHILLRKIPSNKMQVSRNQNHAPNLRRMKFNFLNCKIFVYKQKIDNFMSNKLFFLCSLNEALLPNIVQFLVACTRLYKPLLVGQSVGRSVRPSETDCSDGDWPCFLQYFLDIDE